MTLLLALLLLGQTSQFPYSKGIAVQGAADDGGNVQAYGLICGGNMDCSGSQFGWVTLSSSSDAGGGGGAPTGAQYWTGASDGTLSAEKNLGALSTGLVINTAGVPSAYAGSSCSSSQFATSTNASGALTCAQPAFNDLSGAATDGQIPNSITIDLAAAATALASNPSDCSAGQYATTIAASGNLSCAQVAFSEVSGSVTDSQVPNTITVDLATTATTASALASNPAPCGANNWVTDIAADGTLTCAQPAFSSLSGSATDGQIPNSITIDLAATATALAADPADCSAGQYATTIAASGALTCAQVAFAQLSGSVTDGQVPNGITIDLASTATALAADPADCSAGQYATTIAATGALTCAQVAFSQLSGTASDGQLASNYSGVGACGANTWASTLNDNAAPTCTQPAFSNLSGSATDGQIPDNITISLAATATALASDPSDCASNRYATAINASGTLTCAQVDLSAGVTGTLPIANGGSGITRLANDVTVNVNASYVTVFTVSTIPASSTVSLHFNVVYTPGGGVSTVGEQLRVSSADTGYTGMCNFTTWGVAGTAASATATEFDIIAIGTAPADTAAAASCSTAAACLVEIDCELTSDGSPGNVLLEAQLETGTTNAPIKAGASWYRLINN